MASLPSSVSVSRRDALLLMLTFTTGTVDVLSYLALGGIFTANMTGNTVFLAIAAGQGNVLTADRSIAALVGFCLGAAVAGRHLAGEPNREIWSREITQVLTLDFLLLAAFAGLWAYLGGHPALDPDYFLIAINAAAMGIQSAAARKVGVLGLPTNVLTMAYTGLMAELAALGMSGSDTKRWLGTILALGGGAAVGALLLVHARVELPIVTAAIVGIVLVLALTGSREEVRSEP